MKGSLLVLLVFGAGIVAGLLHLFPDWWPYGDITTVLLYAMVVQIGIALGATRDLRSMFRAIKPDVLLLPLCTIIGTLLFTALAASVMRSLPLADWMAIGSGMGYYSLSSVLIIDMKEATEGPAIAAQLGTMAVLTNIMREMLALVGIPFFARFMGPYAPIAAGGVTSMDVTLPVIGRYAGTDVIPVAIMHGVMLEVGVPLLVTLFCSI